MTESNSIKLITQHYENCWGQTSIPIAWKFGSAWQLPPEFRVLSFKTATRRNMWTYATCGMSQQGDAPALELHLFSPVESASHVELLTAVAHFHVTGNYLDLSHTVNFGRPWLLNSQCEHGLISLPYLDGPHLEYLESCPRKIRFLWLVPITAEELQFKKDNGLDALEKRFETSKFNYLDSKRKSVV